MCYRSITVFGSVLLERGSHIGVPAMVEGLVLDGDDVVLVDFRTKQYISACGTSGTSFKHLQSLPLEDRLNCGMMVLLMDLPVDGCGDFLVLVRPDSLLGHGLSDILIHRGSVLSVSREEAGNCLFGFLHVVSVKGVSNMCLLVVVKMRELR